MKNVYVFGHKNPDTDSVCSAIALAYLKNSIGVCSIPKVIGAINRESKFVLDYFGVDTPSYLNDVKIQIKDLKYVKKGYVNENSSINDTINFMKNNDLTAVPLVDDKKIITGYITFKDVAKYLIGEDKKVIKSNLNLLLDTLNAKVITSFRDEIDGEIQTITFSSDSFIKEVTLDSKSILIVGDRYKVLEHAIDSKVQLIVLSKNRALPEELMAKVIQNKVTVISSSYGSYDICNKICLSNYIKHINVTKKPFTIDIDGYYSDFINVMKKLNYTNYPIVKKNNECVGVLRLVDVNSYTKKNVILVDHNNYEQSIDGLNEAEIVEIIDHHNIGSIGTTSPISFISRPVGCTATIIYEQYRRERVDIPKHIAGLLVSAIISDTLLFTSPTTTELDRLVATELAKKAEIDINEYGKLMLKEASSIKGLSVNELINQDFKSYTINDKPYGIAVITTMDFDEINKNIDEYIKVLDEMSVEEYKGVMLFITDIFKGGSYVIYNTNSEELIKEAFDLENVYEGIFIDELISRKKQILPALMQELESSI